MKPWWYRSTVFVWGFFLVITEIILAKKAPPELSSTLLELHKQYLAQPPHDTSLYRILEVSPNATAAQITRNYRRLSRNFHPDKQQSSSSHKNNHVSTNQAARDQLQQIQKAYEVLKDDSTRLPYHKYGLIDTTLAVVLLLGPGQIHNYPNLQHSLTPLHHELLQMMGYDATATSASTKSRSQLQRQRLLIMAARLVERIRPLVERTVDPSIYFHYITQECDRLKSLPMGAHIIRCIGRAYRHAGQQFLDRLEQQKLSRDLALAMQTQWRQAQQYWTAALASGKAIVSEKSYAKKAKKHQQRKAAKENGPLMVDYPELGDGDPLSSSLSDDESYSLDMPSEEELHEAEQLKAHHTILTALQVEALWKTSKIDLDRTIQKACNMILDGDYFFFPSHQSNRPSEWIEQPDGWVTKSGQTVYARDARERAARAMILIGNAMVHCSKHGTAWLE